MKRSAAISYNDNDMSVTCLQEIQHLERGYKMKLKKWLSAVFTIALAAAVINGCSSGNKSPERTETAAPPSGGESAPKEVEIVIGYYSDAKSEEKMKELIDKFTEKHPNIKVKTQSAPYSQFFQKLDTQIAANQAPDVWLSDGVLVMKYAERGAVRDITDWVERDLDIADYYGLEHNRDHEGHYWAVPQGIQVGVLFYNKEMFDKASVEYPTEDWTWEDLKEAGAKLTLDANGKKPGEDGFDAANISQFGLTFNNITEGWFPVMKSYGGGVLDNTLSKSIIDSPENRLAFEWIVDGMMRGIITDPADIKSFQSSSAPFPSGAAAMRLGLYTRILAANEAGLDYDVTLLPKGPNGERFAPFIANSWVINGKSNDEKAQGAWEWVKYWATEDEVQNEWTALGEAIPVKKSVANSDTFLKVTEYPANRQAFLDSMEFAGTLDANAVWDEWLDKFSQNANRAFLGDISIDEAITGADREVQEVLNQFYGKE